MQCSPVYPSFCAYAVCDYARCRQVRQGISDKQSLSHKNENRPSPHKAMLKPRWLTQDCVAQSLEASFGARSAMPQAARSFGQQLGVQPVAITWPYGPFHSSTQAGKRPRSRGTAHSKSSCSTSRLVTRRGHTFKSMHQMHRGRA